jgi:hypothetical protein
MENEAMTTTATLIAHAGARKVSRADLATIPAPLALGRIHRPIPHADLVAGLSDAVQSRDLEIVREDFAVQDGSCKGNTVPGALIFGVMELRPHRSDLNGYVRDGMTFALGFRSGNNQAMRLQLAAGTRVFVCDNLAFSADTIALSKKHTSRLDLTGALGEGIDRYLVKQTAAVDRIDAAAQRKLPDEAAKALMFDTFLGGYIPTRYLAEVNANYFEPTPEMTDCHGRTLWSLHNAFTRVLSPVAEERDGQTVRVERFAARSKFEATVRLGKLLEIAATN